LNHGKVFDMHQRLPVLHSIAQNHQTVVVSEITPQVSQQGLCHPQALCIPKYITLG